MAVLLRENASSSLVNNENGLLQTLPINIINQLGLLYLTFIRV